MRVALLGGSGRIGQHVLFRALANGHEVAVLARRPQSVPPAAGLTVIPGNATDASAVAEVIAGSEAVLSALGPRGDKTAGLLAAAGRAIVGGMQKASVQRLICVSAAGAFIDGDPDTGRLITFILPKIFAGPFADVRAMEAVVAGSELDWTLVRPTRLLNTAVTGEYRVRPDYPPAGGRRIGRADVAHFIVTALAERSWVRGRPALAY